MKLSSFFNTLNGWQRIFVILLVFIYIPISIGLVSKEDYVPPLKDSEFLKILPDDVLLALKDEKMILLEDASPLGSQKIEWDFFIKDKNYKNKYKTFQKNFSYRWNMGWAINEEYGANNIEKLSNSFQKAIQDYLFKQKLINRLYVAAGCIFAAVIFYLFFWMVGWALKGFRKTDS